MEALQVTVTAPVASFRNPLYSGVQIGLPCPPPATIGGLLAATVGGWDQVPADLAYAAAFTAAGEGVDLETYHPLAANGKPKPATVPKDRPFLADVTLTLWLIDHLDRWEQALRRPVWPLRLGRSQDLAAARTYRVDLTGQPGQQRNGIIPADLTTAGSLLRLPTAIAVDRARTRWDAYRYTPHSRTDIDTGLATHDGQAVAIIHGVHPASLTTLGRAQ